MAHAQWKEQPSLKPSRPFFLDETSIKTNMVRAHDWVSRGERLVASVLLETSASLVEDVAAACGFGTAATMRHHFRAHLRTSPAAHRTRFAGACSATI